jgi:hypothetical protein
MPETEDEIRSRLIRNSDGPLVLGERPDHIDEPQISRHFYRPALPKGYKPAENDQLAVAHTSVDAIADDIRRMVTQVWQTEPNLGISLTAAQKHAWRKGEVKRIVEAELGKRLGLVRPVVEKATKELGKRRDTLTAKGSVKLEGVSAERAMRIADHFARLDPEQRTLMAFEAMNDPSTPENRELLAALAWSHPSLELIPTDTRARIQGVLVATADPDEYSSLTALDNAVQATGESLTALESWAASLPEELG